MSDEKEKSGEEKRLEMKEQFKNDLRERKAFLEKMKNLGKQKKIIQALENMKVEDDSDEWIKKLNEETAFAEAKTEIAMENLKEKSAPVVSDEELSRLVAEEMVKQLKREMLSGNETPPSIPSDNDLKKEEKKEGPIRNMLDGPEV